MEFKSEDKSHQTIMDIQYTVYLRQRNDAYCPSPSHVSHHHLQLHVSVTLACLHCDVMIAKEVSAACIQLAPTKCLPIFTRSKVSGRLLWTFCSITFSVQVLLSHWWPQVGLFLPHCGQGSFPSGNGSLALLGTSTRHNLNTMGSLLAPRREPPCLHQGPYTPSPCLH